MQETLVENKSEEATTSNLYHQQRLQLKQHRPKKIPLVLDEAILRDTEYVKDNSVDVWVCYYFVYILKTKWKCVLNK